ncbi:hypothetical protein OROHE_024199 [Orobanche hederae]
MEEQNMNRLVLKHCVDGIERLSFIFGTHMSPTDNIPLPFSRDDEITGNSCRGLFYFSSLFGPGFEDGKVVICNLTTKKLKLLTSPCHEAFYCDHGLRYDPKSDDYKVIRNQNPASTAEVYSLKNGSWKVISGRGDDVRMDPDSGVYMNGTETFSRMPSPPPLRPPVDPPLLPGQYEKEFIVNLFDCDGFLGVVGRKRVPDHKSRVARHLERWVYRRESWERSFSVILLDVERPLGLSENRFLFLEGSTSSCGHNHLMVYDWVKEELREHAVYGEPPSELLLLSYVDNTVELSSAKPLIDSSKNVEESSQEKAGRMVLQRCRQRREMV